MKRANPANIRSLRDIALERERLRYMSLKTELEFSKQLRQTRKLFTFPKLLSQSHILLTGYLRRVISGWFK